MWNAVTTSAAVSNAIATATKALPYIQTAITMTADVQWYGGAVLLTFCQLGAGARKVSHKLTPVKITFQNLVDRMLQRTYTSELCIEDFYIVEEDDKITEVVAKAMSENKQKFEELTAKLQGIEELFKKSQADSEEQLKRILKEALREVVREEMEKVKSETPESLLGA